VFNPHIFDAIRRTPRSAMRDEYEITTSNQIERVTPGMRATHEPARDGELRYSVADIAAARNAFGYSPTRRLEAELDRVIADISHRATSHRLNTD
jgi:nucleoside-diphosphate-sugar epimerase